MHISILFFTREQYRVQTKFDHHCTPPLPQNHDINLSLGYDYVASSFGVGNIFSLVRSDWCVLIFAYMICRRVLNLLYYFYYILK